ncbi:ABC transporter substrate-binding protein [Natrialbaceae archaeon GCM10025810]|uniref:ABC transporter substrate-binding protein n=1 Tax=Halovalidus salilacus TaxID=3075124 RepID=UPI0036095B80
MVTNGESERELGRDRVRRRPFLRGVGSLAVGVAGVAGVAGCITPDDGPSVDDEATRLIADGFEEAGVDPPLEVDLVTNEQSYRSRWAEFLMDELEATGFFDVSFEPYEWTTYQRVASRAADEERVALICFGWTGGWDPHDYVNRVFHSAHHTPDGTNLNHYESEDADALIEAGIETSDRDERVDIYRDLQEHLAAEVPVSFVRFGEAYHVWSDDVEGWRAYPTSSGTYYPVYAPFAGVCTELAADRDELVVAIPSDVVSADPVTVQDATSLQAIALVYESLLNVDFDGDVVPQLATDWERLDSGAYRFHLRDDARFHNGERLTAEHVVGSFERYEGTIRESVVYDWYDDAEIVDEHTIDVHLRRAFAPFETAVAQVPIVPLAAIDGDHDLRTEPLGTGPYRFDEHQPGSRWRIARFEDHWYEGGAVPATPPIETVTFEVIVESSVRDGAIKAGDVDVSTGVLMDSVSEFEDDPSFGVDRRITGEYECLVYPLYATPFDNEKVRRGCNALIPRERIVDSIYHGIGEPAYTPISPLLEAYADAEFRERIADEYVRLE